MQWRVMVELTGVDGSMQVHEVHAGSCAPAVCSPEKVGLALADAKQSLAACNAASCRRRQKSIAKPAGVAPAAAHHVR